MNDKTFQEDLILANSYLDQELEQEEILAFADKLSESESLRTMLVELSGVKRTMKEIPAEEPRRNYTLTRQMAEKTKKPGLFDRLFPAIKATAVLASFVLIFSFIFPLMNQVPEQKQQMISKSPVLVPDEEVQPMVSDLNAANSVQSDAYTLQMASMPSSGIRGGTPKNEYLMSVSREFPEERNETDVIDAASDDSVAMFSSPSAETPEDTEPLISSKTIRMLQWAFSTLLVICICWIVIVLIKRRKIKAELAKIAL